MIEKTSNMTGRQMNIYLNQDNYIFLKGNISHGKISNYINEAITEKNARDWGREKESLISAYRSMKNNREAKSDENLLDESASKIVYE